MTNNLKGLTKSQALKLLDIIDVKISISNKLDKGDWEDSLSESVHEDLLIKDLFDLCEDDTKDNPKDDYYYDYDYETRI